MSKRFALCAALLACSALFRSLQWLRRRQLSRQRIVAQANPPPPFDTESAARSHCPKGAAVWLNIPSGIYHYRGERWYGHTKHGAYACEKEAIRRGDRASENRQ